MPADRQTLIGKSLGDRYKLLKHLGSGGMGDVFLAEHVLLGKKMAVKILKDDFSHNEEWVTRFQQEAIAASRIGQENIVNVTDIGRTAEGSLYFVMEALDGVNLKSLLMREGSVPLQRALPILIQVTRALGAAHAQGIVHRDLKAENVMVVNRDDGSDFVKILDFGISKVARIDSPEIPTAQQKRLTRVGALMGTPDYMAPEQVSGEGIDHRVDIYAFGVLAYEVVTGTVPFEAPNAMGVLMKHMTEAPQPPSVRRPDLKLPAEFDAFVIRALEKDPAKRFQSMGHARDGLLLCCEAAGITQFTPPPRVPPNRAPGDTASAPVEFARTRVSPADFGAIKAIPIPKAAVAGAPAKSRGWVLALGVAAALVLVGGGGFAAARVFQRPPDPIPVPTPPAPAPPPIAVAPPPPPPVPVEPPPQPAVPPTPTPETHPVAHPAPPRTGALKIDEIRSVFKHYAAPLNGCVNANKDLLPAESGTLPLAVDVRESGAVAAAKLDVAGLNGGKLEACITSKVKQMKFPAHTVPSTFTLPLAYDVHRQ